MRELYDHINFQEVLEVIKDFSSKAKKIKLLGYDSCAVGCISMAETDAKSRQYVLESLDNTKKLPPNQRKFSKRIFTTEWIKAIEL